jgi:tetratricopeptide (TPR) repeat protein
MSSIIEGYNYDIFISYRQKDNKHDGWVTEFVNNLKGELESTFKEEISVYIDDNPHDGLLETHDVDASLKEKLKCLIFIPIISRTYCDPKSFAWEHEFKAFVEMASKDQFGLKVKLPNGNVSSRVLPIQIHEIAQQDKITIERFLGGVLRSIEFIYRESGVNRPLKSNEWHPDNNKNKTNYLNQINKVANSIDEILSGLGSFHSLEEKGRNPAVSVTKQEKGIRSMGSLKSKDKRILIASGILLMVIFIMVLFLIKKPDSDSFESMTSPVTIINEEGQKEIRRVFKENYITKISLFPLLNETNDTSTSWLQNGFLVAIGHDLSQFNYISVSPEIVTRFQAQINSAKKNNSTFFITGSYKLSEGIYDVTSRIYQTSNGKLVSERKFRKNDFFDLIDSLSFYARYDLNIPKSILDKFTDLPFKEQTTVNISAFRYYVKGIFNPTWNDVSDFNKSVALDSTFALALYENAYRHFSLQLNNESARKLIAQAMRHRLRLSQNAELPVRILFYLIHGDTGRVIRLSEMQYNLQPTGYILERLAETYAFIFNIPEYVSTSEKLNEIFPGNTNYQLLLGESYLFAGKYDKGLDVMNLLLKNSPESVEALLLSVQLYLQKKEFAEADKCYQKAVFIKPELQETWSWIPEYISFARRQKITNEFLEQFTGNYRSENTEMYINYILNNNHLLIKEWEIYSYPVSESDFKIATGKFLESFKLTFIRNSRNTIIKVLEQYPEGTDIISWKEDSLIYKAMTLINGNDKKAALDLFRDALSKNPDHYYLQNFIQHLEFIQGEEYQRMKINSALVEGKYGSLTISRKNDILYCTDSLGLTFRLLPMSESSFMSPSIYSKTFRIISRNDNITGIEIFHNGKKKLFPKTK